MHRVNYDRPGLRLIKTRPQPRPPIEPTALSKPEKCPYCPHVVTARSFKALTLGLSDHYQWHLRPDSDNHPSTAA